MEKKIILEELMRIQELMGISVNPNNLLTEATYPQPKGSAFNFNLTPAIRTQLTQQMVDWADNVVNLTKRGASVTFDDLVEYGKKLARDAGDDAANNEAKALYYVAMSHGRRNFMDLMQKIMTVNQQAAKAAFNTDVRNITSQTVRDNLVNMLDVATSQNISTMEKRGIDALLDDLISLRQTIDLDTSIDPATKRSLSKIVDDQIDKLETATMSEYSSRQSRLSTDIDSGTPSPAPLPNKDWSLVEAGVLAATGKKIDFNVNPEAKTFKDLYESGQMSENSAINGMVNYIGQLRRDAADTTLTDAQRRAAQSKLDNVIETGKKVGGAAGDFIVGIATYGTKFLSKFSTKGILKGLLVALLIGGIAIFGDDILYWTESFTESTHAACLRKIPGYDKVILDTEMLYGSTMEDFIQSEYPEDKICEVPGKELTPDQKIKAFTLQQKDDVYYIQVVYENDCKDTISLPDDSDGVPSFVSKKVCGNAPAPSPAPGGKTLAEFETWARKEYETANVSGVDGPDADGIFKVTVLDETLKYKWENNGWVYQR